MRKTIAKSIETAPMVEHSRTVSKPVSLVPNVATIVRATVRIIVIILPIVTCSINMLCKSNRNLLSMSDLAAMYLSSSKRRRAAN